MRFQLQKWWIYNSSIIWKDGRDRFNINPFINQYHIKIGLSSYRLHLQLLFFHPGKETICALLQWYHRTPPLLHTKALLLGWSLLCWYAHNLYMFYSDIWKGNGTFPRPEYHQKTIKFNPLFTAMLNYNLVNAYCKYTMMNDLTILSYADIVCIARVSHR